MISAILLAAGQSVRMGRLKQLIQIGRTPMLEFTLKKLLLAELDEIVLVIGYRSEEIQKVIDCSDEKIKVVVNNRYKEGIGTSISCGIKALSPRSLAAIIVLADQPFIKVSTISALVDAFSEKGDQIIYPKYRGRRGHPVLFSASFFPLLANLSEDKGGSLIIESNLDKVKEIETDDESVIFDIDTPEDINRLGNIISL